MACGGTRRRLFAINKCMSVFNANGVLGVAHYSLDGIYDMHFSNVSDFCCLNIYLIVVNFNFVFDVVFHRCLLSSPSPVFLFDFIAVT